MKKALLFIIIVGFVACLLWVGTGKISVEKVQITRNLEEDGWYWTQFHLPSEGELMRLSEAREYIDDLSSSVPLPKPVLARMGINHGRIFFGYFCCGETRPNRYVYLPTAKSGVGVETLVFFARDGSIWLIPIPEAILTPGVGEETVEATVYR